MESPGEYNDERLFEVLTHVGLYEKKSERRGSSNSLASLASSTDKGAGGRTQPVKSLSEEVSEGGTNFSVGQRQLLVIARAMLTGACIVIMDEATASVDADTDARIQRVFRSEFKNATCITVAHRLNVSPNYRRIVSICKINLCSFLVACRQSWIPIMCLLWMMDELLSSTSPHLC